MPWSGHSGLQRAGAFLRRVFRRRSPARPADASPPQRVAPVLDTLTTRFLMLFVMVLAIPQLSLIIFTVNLLKNHMDHTTFREAQQSDAALQTALARADQTATALLQTTLRPSGALLRRTREQLPPASPGEALMFMEVLERAPQSLSWLRFDPEMPGEQARWGYATAIDDRFLHATLRQTPTLEAGYWILREPLMRAHPHWLARSDAALGPIQPAAINAFLENLPTEPTPHAPLMDLGEQRVRVIQRFLYDTSDRKIARIITLTPTRAAENTISNFFLGMYIIVVCSLLFSVALAILAARRITQPVLSLVHQVTTLNRVSDLERRIEVRGVHEINTLAQAFNRLLGRLRDEHRLKDEFVATLTHDLKVPLLAEQQTLRYLQEGAYGELTTGQAEILQTLAAASAGNLQLVSSILSVYRYESSQVRLHCAPVSLRALMREVMDELHLLAQARQVALSMAEAPTADDDPTVVWADRHEIRRALTNLVGNAIAHTPRHGQVVCDTRPAEVFGELIGPDPAYHDATLSQALPTARRVWACVRDNGVGFPADDLPYLFTPFVANQGRTPIRLGLGLYNCYQILRAHEGTLWVESTEGEGSAVSLLLPTQKQPEPTQQGADDDATV